MVILFLNLYYVLSSIIYHLIVSPFIEFFLWLVHAPMHRVATCGRTKNISKILFKTMLGKIFKTKKIFVHISKHLVSTLNQSYRSRNSLWNLSALEHIPNILTWIAHLAVFLFIPESVLLPALGEVAQL